MVLTRHKYLVGGSLDFSDTKDSHQPNDARIAPTGKAQSIIMSSRVLEKLDEFVTGQTINPTMTKMILKPSRTKIKRVDFFRREPDSVFCRSWNNLKIAGTRVTALKLKYSQYVA